MKNFRYFAVAALLIVFSSCGGFLDKESYTDHDERILTTEEGMRGLLNGIYDAFSHTDYYGRNMYAFEGAKGLDFFVRVSSGNTFERENRYAESTSSGGAASSCWIKIYTAIRTATTLLESIDGVEFSDPAEKKTVKGEATALRALAYFDLMRLFAYPPRFSLPDGEEYGDPATGVFRWGVPIVENMDMVNNILDYEVRRQTAAVTYKYIEDEFIEAQKLMKDSSPVNGRINYTAVCALMARLYLYMNRWDDVIESGEEALRAAANSYSLIGYDNYKTNYYKSFNQENIWELVYSLSDNLGSNSLNSLVRKQTYNNPGAENDGKVSLATGYAAYGLFPATVSLLQQTVNGVEDVRGYLVCDLGVAGQDYRGYRKYVGETYHYVYNLPLVRLPEIYLTLAEAYLMNDDVPSAETYYKLLRTARVKDDSGFSTSDPDACLAELLTERRRELMLEGHTFWDYFRRGATLQRPELLENANKRTIAFGYGTKSYARAQVVYPIPLSELEANRDIRDQQNPGYDTYDDVYIDTE